MDILEWLFTPLSGRADHHLPLWAAWHGRLMVFAWAIVVPLGVLAARYFKVMPGQAWPDELDNKTWWHWHRILQSSGVAVMTFGWLLALHRGQGASALAQVHRWMGWSLLATGWLQVLGGLLRGSKGGDALGQREPKAVALRGDHYDMTARRRVFEHVHKVLGTAAVIAAVVAIGIGLVLADAPRWMAVVLGLWWVVLAVLAVRWQRQGRCIDTYQAIWGPDPAHPGNRIRTIGWGVSRYSRETWNRRFAGRPPQH